MMNERLEAIIRLCKKYHTKDIHFDQNNGSTTINIRVDGRLRKVKSKDIDNELFEYVVKLSDIKRESYQSASNKFKLVIDGVQSEAQFAVSGKTGSANGILRLLNLEV